MVAIAIANQKGGVGKTTVTLGLAEAAYNRGLKVLVVDCDPQANATAGLGLEISDGLTQVLDGEIILDQNNRAQYISESPWTKEMSSSQLSPLTGCIDVLGAHPHLSSVESQLGSDPIGACDRLERALELIGEEYELILFDCPPSIGLLTINALFASDEVIVVSAPSAWSSDGVEIFTKNVDRISSRRDGRPKISGIVVNNVSRTRDARFWESEILGKYEGAVHSIASRAAIAEASAMSSPLGSLGSRPGAKQAIENFDNVFLKLIGLRVDDPKVGTSNNHEQIKEGITNGL